jgi:prepilin-type processing-associated H-X9-DG protein
MRTQSSLPQFTHPRSGLSIIDVTVVVFCLLVLAALVLPAVADSREAVRRVECQNNMKMLTTATMVFASKSNGRLPSLSSRTREGITSNWLVDLLPGLEEFEVLRKWDSLSPVERTKFEVSLEKFQCPVDPTSFHQDGGLSYVANSGFGNFKVDPKTNAVSEIQTHGQGSVDWNGDGIVAKSDILLTISSGVFWPKHQDDKFRSNLDFISLADGQRHTILFAESLHAGKWNSAKTLDLAFVVGVDRITPRSDGSEKAYFQITKADLGPYGINGSNVPRHTPSPSSNHGGKSIFGFADGSARQIPDRIDPIVYLKLITPNGQRYGETIDGLQGL